MIQLHVDLDVDPAQEQQAFAAFRDTFSPAICQQPGFTDVQLLRLRGETGDFNYRLLIGLESEEQRQQWVGTPLHQEVWPLIERTLRRSKYAVRLYDVLK